MCVSLSICLTFPLSLSPTFSQSISFNLVDDFKIKKIFNKKKKTWLMPSYSKQYYTIGRWMYRRLSGSNSPTQGFLTSRVCSLSVSPGCNYPSVFKAFNIKLVGNCYVLFPGKTSHAYKDFDQTIGDLENEGRGRVGLMFKISFDILVVLFSLL